MSLTLQQVGKMIPTKGMLPEIKKRLNKDRAIDLIIEQIENSIWIQNVPPKIKIKGLGSKVLVLRAATGSGKSAVLPPSLYDAFFERIKKNIVVTQPTKATATSIPFQLLPYNKHLKLGQNIGFQTGSISKKPVKGILFCTVGILLQHLMVLTDEEFMKKYSFVIIDEVHQRSIDVDLVLYYLKKLLSKHYEDPNCPFVILTSGTFDPKIFMDYFECPQHAFLDVVGLSNPIEDNFTPFDLTNCKEYIVDLVEKIHIENLKDIQENKTFRDILVFVQGSKQISDLEEDVHKLNSMVFSKGLTYATKHMNEQQKKYSGAAESQSIYLLPIGLSSAQISKGSKEYMQLYSDIDTLSVPIYKYKGDEKTTIINTVKVSRRVMIGTNAIETGITIDTLGYCIDSGWVNEAQFNPNFGSMMLLNKNVTKASARQRRGRVGRKAPGTFYGCYTKETYEKLPALPFPEIVKEDMSRFLLSMIISETETTIEEIDYEKNKKSILKQSFKNKTTQSVEKSNHLIFQMNQFDQKWYALESKKDFQAQKLDFIQYPTADSMMYGLEKLYILGFISQDYKPTLFGYYASKFRKIKLENVRMILACYANSANVLDLITIACFLEVGANEIGIKRNKYICQNPLGLTPEQADYYYKILFADEFVEYIFIWQEFMNAVDTLGKSFEKNIAKQKKTLISSQYLNKWAEENSFKLDGLLQVVELRDEVITDMLSLGLNPYYNGLDLARGNYNLGKILRRNLSEGIAEVLNIKKCVLDGYRMNLCILDEQTQKYILNGIQVKLSSKIVKPINSSNKQIEQLRPKKIILGNLQLRQNMEGDLYEFTSDCVSVMDGFVDVDVDFMLH